MEQTFLKLKHSASYLNYNNLVSNGLHSLAYAHTLSTGKHLIYIITDIPSLYKAKDIHLTHLRCINLNKSIGMFIKQILYISKEVLAIVTTNHIQLYDNGSLQLIAETKEHLLKKANIIGISSFLGNGMFIVCTDDAIKLLKSIPIANDHVEMNLIHELKEAYSLDIKM